MSVVAYAVIGGQSQAGNRFTNTGVRMAAALSGASWTQTGISHLASEFQRRCALWSMTTHGAIAANLAGVTTGSTGAGGSSWIDDTIDPTAGSGDDTPLTGNSDSRLTSAGQTYMASLDTILALSGKDAYAIVRDGYSFDVQETKGQSKVNQCRAERLWWGLIEAKLIATGKPYRMFIIPPGLTDRADLLGHYIGMLHETQMHMAGGNGMRSADPAIAGFAAIPNLYVLGGAQCYVASSHTNEADNLAPDTGLGVNDYTHQSVESNVRLVRQIALELARWLEPGTVQEFNGAPTIHSCIWDAANNRVRVRFNITPGNRLVWSPRPAEDAATQLLEAGADTAPYYYGHILLHAHRLYQPVATYERMRPVRIAVSAIDVDNSFNAIGTAYLDLTLPAGITPTRGTCFSIFPSKYGRHYWRRTENIDPGLKLLDGLWEEAGSTPYVVSAACEDVLAAGRTMMFPLPYTNVPVVVG
jgi:hypothetical protein